MWLRSEYRQWPNGLGFDEQDPDLVTDFQTLLAVLDYQMTYLKQDEKDKKNPKHPELKTEPDVPPIPTFESL